MPGPVSSSWSLSPPAALSVSTPSPGSSALRPWGHTLVPSSPGTPWLGLLLFPGEQGGRNPGEGPSTGRPSPLGHQHLQKRLVPHGHHEGVLDDADELLSEVMRDRGRGAAGGGSTSTGLCGPSLPSVGNSLCFGPSGSSSGMAWPRVSPGFPTSTQVALGDRASPMRVTAAGSAIAPDQGTGTQQRSPGKRSRCMTGMAAGPVGPGAPSSEHLPLPGTGGWGRAKALALRCSCTSASLGESSSFC